MPTAKRITEALVGKAGEAYGYELSEPFNGVDHVIVSCIDWTDWGLKETRITPATVVDGEVIMLVNGDNTLALSKEMPFCTHAEALKSIGYRVSDG
jgi:hypothetical protein